MNHEKGQVIVQPLAQRLSYHLFVARAWKQVERWWTLARQRRALARLDRRMLKDIGLSRADALAESVRPFWDDPLKKVEARRGTPSVD